MRCLCLLVLVLDSCAAQTLSSVSYGGSGNDTVNRIASDAAGNLYVVGTTTSFDLPLRMPWQPANAGSQIAFSTDAGVTWQAMANLSQAKGALVPVVAADPKNPNIVYAGLAATVYKSIDHGKHFTASVLPATTFQTAVSGLAIDPVTTSTVYASGNVNGGVFKSTDGGVTWVKTSNGLPANGFVSSLAMDPFHARTLWAWAGTGAYASRDGGESWTLSALPMPQGSSLGGTSSGIVFDAVKPGILYGPSLSDSGMVTVVTVKSVDGGATWSTLALPFSGFGLVADPVRSGYLYAIAAERPLSITPRFYVSADGGLTWSSYPFPGVPGAPLAVDPSGSGILLAGGYRSDDGGQTWSPTGVSRAIRPFFAAGAKGVVYAGAPITSDVFLAKYQPGGTTLAFATYFGGMGAESAASVKIDGSGNAWILGTTSSYDLPVTLGALQTQLKGQSNLFLAEFSPGGQLLYCSYLGSSGADAAKALDISPNGAVWITGTTTAGDYPISTGPVPRVSQNSNLPYAVVSELDSSGQTLLFSSYFGGTGGDRPSGVAVDPSGSAILTGTTYSADFPVSGGALRSAALPSVSVGKAFLVKFDASGVIIFSTYIGGTKPLPPNFTVLGSSYVEEKGVAVATDSSANIYLTGNTSMTDFPVTAGAYQTTLGAGCTYPAYYVYTGLIGTISIYLYDDVFVSKLSPDGKTLISSTLLGGACYDRPTDIVVGPDGKIYIAGETDSADFPLSFPIESAPQMGGYRSFLSVLDPAQSTLRFSTYLSAGANPALALSPDGILHVGGSNGLLAQTSNYVGGLFGPVMPNTDGYLGALDFSGPNPDLNLTRVSNAFSLIPGPVAPGEIVALAIPGLNPSQSIDIGLNGRAALTDSLAGVSVYFDGQSAPVVSVASGKVVAIAPVTLTPAQDTTVQVTYNGGVSNSMVLSVVPAAIGMLSLDGSGAGPGNARNDDGQLNTSVHPAARGSYVTVYFTGGGEPPARVTVDGWPADTAPLDGFVPGIDSARFLVPADPTLPNKLSISLYSAGSMSQTLTVYIQY